MFSIASDWLLEEFAGYLYGEPQELLNRAIDWRMFEGFAADFGLASTFREEHAWTEPHQVWVGPLLAPVVGWKR